MKRVPSPKGPGVGSDDPSGPHRPQQHRGTERIGRLDRPGSEWRDRPAQQQAVPDRGVLYRTGASMTYLRITFRGSLALFGVALGLIGTAGVASADDAAPAPDEGSVVVTIAQEDGAEIGENPVFIERPAPRPDP